MNNKKLFAKWYGLQINSRGKQCKESGARVYIAFIRRLVDAGLVGNNIFEVGADEFMRQINLAKENHQAAFVAQEDHANLSNGIKWWKRFLDAQEGR